MKAIFLCERKTDIFTVYSESVINEINQLTGIEKRLYDKAAVLSSPESFSDVEYIFSTWGMPEFTEEEIKTCFPSLKCLFYGAGSIQWFAHSFIKRGVRIFSAWAANAIPVAEMTVAQIILSNKGYFISSRLYHEKGRRIAHDTFKKCKGNYGEVVGIIGAGMIGSTVARMLKAYNLKVLIFDKFMSDERIKELGAEKCDLQTIFRNAFVITNHLANNKETEGIINYELFSQMRENAVFINTGRGAQVVEEDLVRVLREREDLTALLDVTFPEPPIENHPFYTLKNCRLTPHIAGSSGSEIERLGDYMLAEFKAYLSGGETKYEVTKEMLATMA